MRKLYPMPVDGLFGHPDWVALPAAARGMLMSLCEHFWRTDCRPLPRDDDQLFAIARAHRPTWRHHKPMILSVFKTLEPELAAYWRLRETKGTTIRFVSEKGGAKTRAKALAEASSAPPTFMLPTVEGNAAPRPVGRAKAAKPEVTRMTDVAA